MTYDEISLDSFLDEFKQIIQTIESDNPVFDYGIQYNKQPFIYSEYTLHLEVERIDGLKLDKITKLGYEITCIDWIDDEERSIRQINDKRRIRIYFKKK